jgi:hypothetical protein
MPNKVEPVRVPYETLSKLTDALNIGLRDGRAIRFHNNHGVFVRHDVPGFDAVMVCGNIGQDSKRLFNVLSEKPGIYPSLFVPYQREFFKNQENGVVPRANVSIKGQSFQTRPFGICAAAADSPGYGPVIGRLELQDEDLPFSFIEEERFYCDQKEE